MQTENGSAADWNLPRHNESIQMFIRDNFRIENEKHCINVFMFLIQFADAFLSTTG